ncbi:MAG: FprA family A-type flavoprotein [Lachnospiraceae bacterium]|jgi:flavorubredoxin
MYCTRKITDSIHWVGGNDRRLALFENLFPVPNGVSYNSYVILDEKTVLMDTADPSIRSQFLENVQHVLNGRSLDYLVINHMEPDHCSAIADILALHPEVKLVGNAKTFQIMGQFYEISDLSSRSVIVKEGDTLELGSHTLTFAMTPMVHWPEVMVTYEVSEKVLFSADAFGTFGALNGNIFNDEINFDRDWLNDARRYYTNIVGKFGAQVQNAIKKLSTFDIEIICPLHGPIWRNHISYLLDKYQLWSTYTPEEKSVVILYGSMYGNTENAANVLAAMLADKGIKNIAVYDVSSTHVSQCISESFRASHIVLAAPTYNGGLYPAMEHVLLDMKALNLQNRTVALLDNGSWASTASKQMKAILETMKNMTVLETSVSLKSSLKDGQLEVLETLAGKIAEEVQA